MLAANYTAQAIINVENAAADALLYTVRKQAVAAKALKEKIGFASNGTKSLWRAGCLCYIVWFLLLMPQLLWLFSHGNVSVQMIWSSTSSPPLSKTRAQSTSRSSKICPLFSSNLGTNANICYYQHLESKEAGPAECRVPGDLLAGGWQAG